MKIVIISYLGVSERYVIEKIVARYPSTVVVRPVRATSASARIGPLLRGMRAIPKMIGRIAARYHRHCLKRRLYRGGRITEIPAIVTVREDELNGPAGIDLVRGLEPDVLITCGSPLLGSDLLQSARRAAINLHYGIAPNYRGNDTLFWPMLHRDFHNVGGCIHHLSAGVDSGNLLAVVRPALRPGDGQISIEHKLSVLFAQVVPELLDVLERSDSLPSGMPQVKPGRNFLKKERSPGKRMQYHAMKVLGLLRPTRREQEIVRYFD